MFARVWRHSRWLSMRRKTPDGLKLNSSKDNQVNERNRRAADEYVRERNKRQKKKKTQCRPSGIHNETSKADWTIVLSLWSCFFGYGVMSYSLCRRVQSLRQREMLHSNLLRCCSGCLLMAQSLCSWLYWVESILSVIVDSVKLTSGWFGIHISYRRRRRSTCDGAHLARERERERHTCIAYKRERDIFLTWPSLLCI